MMIEMLGNFLILLATIILMGYTLPQIILNWKIKSGAGISDGMLLGNLNLNLAGLLYVYSENMPFIYRVTSPVSSFGALLLCMQRIYYNGAKTRNFAAFLFLNLFCFVIIALITMQYPSTVGI